MPEYRYLAINTEGREIRGSTSATSMEALLSGLERDNLELIEVDAKSRGVGGDMVQDVTGREKVSRRELADLFFQLSVLLQSGVTLLKALDLVGDDIPNRRFKGIIRNLSAQVQSGNTLADSMAQFPLSFPLVSISLMRVAERSGTTPVICAELRKYLEWLDKLYGDIRAALLMPSILIMAVIAFMFVIFTFVMPKFIAILEEIKLPLPWLTKQVIAFTHLFQYYWLHMIVGAAVVVVIYKLLMKYYPPFGIWMDRTKLKLPLFGEVNMMICISRFGRNLATMYRSGILLLESLKICRDLVGNRAIALAVDQMHDGVATGRKINEMMREANIFPSLIIQMVTTGENTGQLAESLDNMVNYYDDQLPRKVKAIFGVLEPAIIVGLILIVGTVALSVFLPIAQMMSTMK
jgi:type IV pilus assembly protein PilC